jgi:hypothetical protein
VLDGKQIESALVANYGQQILAAPSHKGFDLLAWWLPIAGVLAGALVLAFGVWRWSRRRSPRSRTEPAGSGLDEEDERRSTTSWHASSDGREARHLVRRGLRLGRAAVRAAARPGYLAALSSVEAGQLGQRGTARSL